jgi:hypothetical protein
MCFCEVGISRLQVVNNVFTASYITLKIRSASYGLILGNYPKFVRRNQHSCLWAKAEQRPLKHEARVAFVTTGYTHKFFGGNFRFRQKHL